MKSRCPGASIKVIDFVLVSKVVMATSMVMPLEGEIITVVKIIQTIYAKKYDLLRKRFHRGVRWCWVG